ncbi:restriction endonuclease subunit S [Psychrobacter alimentarius]|uniref:restriction endonuclease subunit S n=1 Tax=Psychrobacter alimentarius TaxID=261164 RepID=UPI003FD130F0
MASDWEEVVLGDYVDHQKGYIFKSKDYQDEGELIVRVSDFTDRSIDISSCNRIDKLRVHEFESVKLNAHDVIIATVGSWPKNPASIVGKTVSVPKEAEGALLNQNAVRLRAINGVEQRFLFSLLKNKAFQSYIVSTAQGSANQASITLRDIFRYSFELPPLAEQKAIAHILGSLDDKIELNRQMNETLESMAQALFKSWFVDFDPVIDNALAAGNSIPDEFAERAEQRKGIEKKDNADIQKLFPDEFEFTEEMGWIPRGWASGTIADISFVKGGYAFKSKDFTDTGFPVIKIKNINSNRTVNTSDVQFIPNEISKKAESFWLKTGDLIMAMTGATVGKFGLLVAENKKVYLLNQRVAKFSPISSVSDKIWFVYCFLNQKSTIDYIVNIAEGSAQPNISADSIMATQLVKPSDELINIFNETVDSNLNKMLMNREECLTLEKLRDTLLPKLMSGELSIPDAAALVDETI